MVWIFTRDKKTGKKKIISQIKTEEEARIFCQEMNKPNNKEWFEFTRDRGYI